MYLTKKLVNWCETFHLSLQFGKWKTCFRRQWNYLYYCLFQICTFPLENNSVCEFCMCTSAHTLCVYKQSVECGVMSIFNQSIFYFHGNWARLMLWNSNCQKFRTLNMDLSNAALGNFKWTSEQLFTYNNRDLLWCPFNGVRFKTSCFFVPSSCGRRRRQWNFLT